MVHLLTTNFDHETVKIREFLACFFITNLIGTAIQKIDLNGPSYYYERTFTAKVLEIKAFYHIKIQFPLEELYDKGFQRA